MQRLYEQGLCVEGSRSDLFFSDDVEELGQAQSICRECSVQLECLRTALEDNVEWGVWGGVIFWDGQPFYRRRGRGRPRNEDVGKPLEADVADLWAIVRSA